MVGQARTDIPKDSRFIGCYLKSKKVGQCRITHDYGGIEEEAEYVDGKKHGFCFNKFPRSRIKKGNYENGKQEGTWEWYYPPNAKRRGYKCKIDFSNGKAVSE